MQNLGLLQDKISFLESYITEMDTKIEELTTGIDFEKEIRSLEYRLEILKTAPHKYDFGSRIEEVTEKLGISRTEYGSIEPTLKQLEHERAYYRKLHTGLKK